MATLPQRAQSRGYVEFHVLGLSVPARSRFRERSWLYLTRRPAGGIPQHHVRKVSVGAALRPALRAQPALVRGLSISGLCGSPSASQGGPEGRPYTLRFTPLGGCPCIAMTTVRGAGSLAPHKP